MVIIRGKGGRVEEGKAGINGDEGDLIWAGGHTIQYIQMLYSRTVYLKPV